ncbi:hypothetical protein ACIBCH_20545 [Amycolatopsis thailandensis]|uniref:hypothetical protein n=1 Tax=Amycolatopsis thailandensis TaxID=589330 RepID=UPI003795EFE5
MAFTAGQKVRASDLNDISAPTAKYYSTATQSLPNNTDVKLQFNAVEQAATAYVTAGGTNNNQFTAVKAGVYEVEAGVRSSSGVMELAVYSPGNVAFAIGNVRIPAGSGGKSCSTSGKLILAANDTFAVNAFNGGTTGNVDTNWGRATHITIKYLGSA